MRLEVPDAAWIFTKIASAALVPAIPVHDDGAALLGLATGAGGLCRDRAAVIGFTTTYK